MSKSYRGTFFAVGLVAGTAIAFAFLVWSFPGFRDPAYQDVRYSHAQNDAGDNNPVIRPSFWETYTTPADTYAQWIMASLAVVATVVSVWAVRLVRSTLSATLLTVEQAKAGNELIRGEQRPWLDIELSLPNGILVDRQVVNLFLKVSIRNLGKMPAVGVSINPQVVLGLLLDRSHVENARSLVRDRFAQYPEAAIAIIPGQAFPLHFSTAHHVQEAVGRTIGAYVNVNVIVGVAYRIAGKDEIFSTISVFELYKRSDDKGAIGEFITMADAHIPVEDTVICPVRGGMVE